MMAVNTGVPVCVLSTRCCMNTLGKARGHILCRVVFVLIKPDGLGAELICRS